MSAPTVASASAGILSWWWMSAFSLRFMDGLAGFLVPSLENISLFDTLSFGVMGLLGLLVSLALDLAIFLTMTVVYYAREVMLYLFVLLMPIMIALWVPGVGPFSLLSKLMKRLSGFYVPFLFMTVPVALLFRLGELLGSSVTVSMGGFGQWIMALITPLIAVAVPFVLFWQASGIFLMADRVAGHASRRRVRERTGKVQSAHARSVQGGRNFARGVRGEPARRSNGQVVFNSGNSRAHRAGTRLSTAAGTLRDRLQGMTVRDGPQSSPGGGATPSLPESAGGGSPPRLPAPSGATPASESGQHPSGENSQSGDATGSSRNQHFENLRDGPRSRTNIFGGQTTDRSSRSDPLDDPLDTQADE